MTHHDDDQIPGEPESALAMPVLDIDREFITETTNLLTRFAPDASVRRADAFAAAYRAERGILPIESDDSTLNDSSAVVRTRDIHALDGCDYRIVACGMDRNATELVESALRRELDALETTTRHDLLRVLVNHRQEMATESLRSRLGTELAGRHEAWLSGRVVPGWSPLVLGSFEETWEEAQGQH